MKRFLVPGLIFIFLFGGTALCQWHIYQKYKKPDFLLDRIFLLPKPETLKLLCAGYEATIVDLLWIRGVQYYGQHFSTLCKPPEKGEGLINLFHALIELDPDFIYGYKWGAFILAESMNDPERCPGGARRAIDEFLVPAMVQFPNDVSLPAEAGFIALWEMEDSDLAVEFFERAASIPGAPPHFKRMIPYVRSQEGSLPSLILAYSMYWDMYQQPRDESERQIADKHLRRIMVRIHLFHLKEGVENYKKKTGHAPKSLADLVREGVVVPMKYPEWPIPPQALAGLVSCDFSGVIPLGPGGEEYLYLPKSDRVVVRGEQEERQRDFIAMFNHYLGVFQKDHGRCPESLEELVPQYLNQIPPDPLEMERVIDPVDCTVVLEVP